MSYAVMPMGDYENICDSIREKTGSMELLKSGEIESAIADVYEAGKQAEDYAFWDFYQSDRNGELRKSYQYAFAGGGWNDNTFKPKHNIVPIGTAYNAFCQCAITDLSSLLKKYGVDLDLSQATRTDMMFYYAVNLTRVPALNVSGVTYGNGINSMFQDCHKLHTIEKLILTTPTEANGLSYISANGNAFARCNALTNITIEGKIGTNGWDFHYSPLSKASITSIINAMATPVDNLTITFSGASVAAAFGSTASGSEWDALIKSKREAGWTISLV